MLIAGDEGFRDLVSALAVPDLAAVTVMHAHPGVTREAIGVVRQYYAGPIGAYAETGDWTPPNWVFSGLTPEDYAAEAVTWTSCGAQLIGGCCGTGPDHIALLAARLGHAAR